MLEVAGGAPFGQRIGDQVIVYGGAPPTVKIIVIPYAVSAEFEFNGSGTSSIENEVMLLFRSTLNILPFARDNANSPVPPSITADEALTSK